MSFWYEQNIGELPLIQGLCLPSTSSLKDAKQQIATKTPTGVFAVSNDRDECLGTLTALAVWQGAEQLGADACLSDLECSRNTILQADDLIVSTVAGFTDDLPPVFAVVDHKMFRGLMSSSRLLQHIVSNHLTVPSSASQDIGALSRQFVSQVAHDIRNPLSIISAVSALIEQTPAPDAQLAHYMRLIKRASNQTLQISDGLIQMERYTCKNKLERATVNLEDFLQEITEENAGLVAYRGQELVVKGCPTKMVMFDTYLLKRALLNLIDNACKFSKARGRIYLTAECRNVDGVEMVDFVVKDEGIGITEAQGQTIFEPFQKLKTDKDALGYGLGLTIAKRFAQFHNGTIEMRRIPSGGAAFVLSIPCQAAPCEQETNKKTASSVSTARPF